MNQFTNIRYVGLRWISLLLATETTEMKMEEKERHPKDNRNFLSRALYQAIFPPSGST